MMMMMMILFVALICATGFLFLKENLPANQDINEMRIFFD
jgi:hypothetical protein